jgi:hypothetical protein
VQNVCHSAGCNLLLLQANVPAARLLATSLTEPAGVSDRSYKLYNMKGCLSYNPLNHSPGALRNETAI